MQARVLTGPVSKLSARVSVPSSKSLTNRGLVAAAVAGGGVIEQPLDCEDTRLLAQALAAAGWPLSWDEQQQRIEVGARAGSTDEVRVHLGNSGTGARLVLGLLAAVPGVFVVDGTPRLRQRPMAPLLEGLQRLGADFEDSNGFLPVRVTGQTLPGGRVSLQPGASSQFVSSLLLAAPLMRQGLELELEGEIPSRPYLDLTEDVLHAFGAILSRDPAGRCWQVATGGVAPISYPVEGDWSAAAFFLAAAAVTGGTSEVRPLRLSSRQGDRLICDVLARAGMAVTETEHGVHASGPVRAALEADLNDTPDMFPALAAAAACLPQPSVLVGLEHLKHKESDRLSVMVDNLSRLGARLEVDGTSFKVLEPIPAGSASGTKVTAAADHRIAMAMAVAALHAGALELDDSECVQKSFPDFWQVWDSVAR
jgi:3-phosphoshikimate 1-carboxyvinyltransferase